MVIGGKFEDQGHVRHTAAAAPMPNPKVALGDRLKHRGGRLESFRVAETPRKRTLERLEEEELCPACSQAAPNGNIRGGGLTLLARGSVRTEAWAGG